MFYPEKPGEIATVVEIKRNINATVWRIQWVLDTNPSEFDPVSQPSASNVADNTQLILPYQLVDSGVIFTLHEKVTSKIYTAPVLQVLVQNFPRNPKRLLLWSICIHSIL